MFFYLLFFLDFFSKLDIINKKERVVSMELKNVKIGVNLTNTEKEKIVGGLIPEPRYPNFIDLIKSTEELAKLNKEKNHAKYRESFIQFQRILNQVPAIEVGIPAGPSKKSSLHIAAKEGLEYTVYVLLEKCSNVLLLDGTGKNAEELARENGHTNIADKISRHHYTLSF